MDDTSETLHSCRHTFKFRSKNVGAGVEASDDAKLPNSSSVALSHLANTPSSFFSTSSFVEW